jgi:hypothetical protein
MLTLSTLYQILKTEEKISMSVRRTSIEKERKKVEKYFKTNVLVPNTKNVRRWRHRSGYTYLLFGETVRADATVVRRAV